MRTRTYLVLAFLMSLVAAAVAQQRTVRAIRTTEPVVIDGRLSEEAWSRAEPASEFTQKDPDEGKPATELTEVRIMFDGDALYIGARMHDREASRIGRRLTGRDETENDVDRLMVYLDPRHDRRTGVEFWISAGGVQRDSVISNDTREDNAWNAVWGSAVTVDDDGWVAEMRIPYSQLRFNEADSQTWGLNLARFIARKNETAWLELVPKNEDGLASRMIPLVGLDGIRSGRHFEIAPYVAARQELVAPGRSGDPFNDGSRQFGSIGIDLKTRVLGGLTLDATFNPDFGQAEVDPAVVNLSAFETFFPERRRFFIEGADIFGDFGTGGANNFFGFNTADPQLFYSRRIGRAPQGRADGEFVDLQRSTTIVGAAKLTGKTANGWSIGLIEALTSSEHSRVRSSDLQSKVEVEPPTNYFVARAHHDFSRAGAGFLTTSVVRDLSSPQLRDLLTTRAFVFGGDGFFFFDRKKTWVVTGKLSGSHISGSEAAITRQQLASQRYYQRPDAPQVSFDPTRRSLSGYAGRVNLNRNEGTWRVNATLFSVSPGFESNDLGFHQGGDSLGGHVVVMRNDTKVRRWARSSNIWLARAWVANFNRELTSDMWFSCGRTEFHNYWRIDGCMGHFMQTLDDDLTRGGPLAVTPTGTNMNFGFGSDERKRVSFQVNGGRDWNAAGGRGASGSLTVNLKALPSLSISTGPDFNKSRNVAQYVGTRIDPGATATFGNRYVFAPIDQTQLSLTTRVTYILTPNVSLKVFMQPLLATGDYGPFRSLAAPRTFDFEQYFAADGTGGLGDPDYNFKSLKLNAVFRWEFTPGSTIYGVWTQQREDARHPGQFRLRRDLTEMFSAPADDIFLVKMTYWIGR